MTRPHDISIDRIIVDGVDLSPEQAEVLRRAVETQLASALEERGPGGAPARPIPHVQTTLPATRGARTEADLAAGVAHAVAQVIRNVR